MPPITIPKSAHKSLEALIRLEEHDFSRLLGVLSEVGVDLSTSHFAEVVAERFSDNGAVIETIVSELFQIDGLRDTLNLTPEQLGRTVADAAADLDFASEGGYDILKKRLQQLFEVQTSLSLTAKAGGIASDFDRVFYSARILTDIRPVFDKSGSVVEAASIVHNLVIHYGQDAEHKDIYLALDVQDVEVLREALDRAATKANSLRAFIRDTKVSYLSPK